MQTTDNVKMSPKKKKLIIAGVTIAIVIIAIVLLGIFLPIITMSNDRTNAKQISIEDRSIKISGEQIVIPVKMKNGISTPTHQKFHSDLTILQLCELAKDYDSKIKYAIQNDKAYIYKEKKGTIVARGLLYDNHYIFGNLNYTLCTMKIEGIIFPLHLTEKFFDEQITINDCTYQWYAVSFMTIEQMVEWLEEIGLYNVQVNDLNNTIICQDAKTNKDITEIYFDGNLIAVRKLYD